MNWVLLGLILSIEICLVFSFNLKDKFFYVTEIDLEASNLDLRRRLNKVYGNDLRKSKFHKCLDGGEAYSASYLISSEHLKYQFTSYNLSRVNCEMGSFIMMNPRRNKMINHNLNGTVVQTIDVLDFSVIHLSAYERLMLRWGKKIGMKFEDFGGLSAIFESSSKLKNIALQTNSTNRQFKEQGTTIFFFKRYLFV